MTKLTDTQRILLSNASNTAGGSLYPLPPTLKASGGITKAVDALIAHGFAVEREVGDPSEARRVDGDLRYGVFITRAGEAAIGVLDDDAINDGLTATPAPSSAANAAKTGTKTAAVLALLDRTEGASMPELIAATGWLPHTTRAALTGLRKKGHIVERSKRGDVSCYRLAAAR